MTTVLADAAAGVMVCDSKCTEGNTWFPMTKVSRNGAELIGIAGHVKEASAWMKWYLGGKKGARPKMENFGGLILRPDGLYSVAEDAYEMKIDRGFHAIGSGGACALGAFMAGADAEKAVQIACQVDAGSGGAVVVHKLK